MRSPRNIVREIVGKLKPFDVLELEHINDVLAWIDGGHPLFRVRKPDDPPKHLVSYFVLFDEAKQSLMLVDHVKAGLWLPTGGHVDVDEDPRDTVVREAQEELRVVADFDTPFGDEPLFVTVTRTQNADTHTDVSLWYLIRGDVDGELDFDRGEMNSCRWLTIDEILATDIAEMDPQMHRFARKLNQRLGTMTVFTTG